MRKFSSFMAAAVAMLAAVSCNKEINNIDPVTPGTDAVVYTAYVDGAETKTSLGATEGEGEWKYKTTRTQWDANDQITIHNGTNGYTFTASEINGGSAKFTYEGNDFSAGEGVMAVYPAGNYTVNVENKIVNAYIPTYQGAREGDYNEAAALAVAYSKNDKLIFKNATALLKFRVNSTNIKAIEFYGHNNDAITGNVQVSLNDDNTVKSVEGLMTTFTWEDETTSEEYGTWVKFYSEDEANNWCLKTETDYYVAIAPHTFEKGVAVNLILADDTKVEKYKSFADPLTIEPSTILDLGELEYTAPGAGSSGWSLPGTYNDWSTTETFLYEEGDYYVAKNVSGLNSGFKFTHSEYGWKGVGSTDPVAVGQWHNLVAADPNICLADAKAYDIYMTKDGKQFQAVAAGSPAPEAPIVEADYWGIIGSMAGSDWATDLKLTEEGDYLVVKNIALKTTDEFKFRKNGLWEEQKIAEGGNAKADTEYNMIDAGSSNMKISTAGTYDVYVTKDMKKVYFMTSGKTPNQAGQAQTQTVEIYANTNHTNLWAWLPDVGNLNLTGGNWPGYTATTVSITYKDVTYTKKWTLNVPTEYMENQLMVIFSGSGNQTADSGPFGLEETMYFTVDNESNVVSQSK